MCVYKTTVCPQNTAIACACTVSDWNMSVWKLLLLLQYMFQSQEEDAYSGPGCEEQQWGEDFAPGKNQHGEKHGETYCSPVSFNFSNSLW